MHDHLHAPTEDTAASETVDTTGGGEGIALSGLRRGTAVGRFVVLDELGAGGMGVVVAAYDPELGRKVALKFLRSGAGSPAARTRLLREAQALAKLNHPNVVAIHDVGAFGDRVWLALEFVEGRTLGEWRGERRWSWREILDVMLQAGRGLQAAHAAGLVHRDFKPDNVMVGADGRVRVMDLGLARLGEEAGDVVELPATDSIRPELPVLGMRVTQAGAVLGTPGYMAPEQLFGLPVGPAADVFAFAVTLWEALFGARPYAGRSYSELVANLRAARVPPPPPGARVPRWLRRVLERGLAVAPEQRWPNMQVFLAELARGHTRARLRIAGVIITLIALCIFAAWLIRRAEHTRRADACLAAGAAIESVWNPDARTRVRDGLVATGVGHASVTADKIMPWLDRQAERWQAARTEACLAADLDGRWDAGTLDRALWCLGERRAELATFIDALAGADAQVVQRAVAVAAGLEPIATCLDPARLALLPAPPIGARERLRAVQRDLARAANHEAAGHHAEGLEAAREALARAEPLAWPPLVAAARYRVGIALERSGEYPAAARALEDAYFAAVEGSAPGVAADAARALARTLGTELSRPVEAHSWLRHAAVLVRALEPEPGLRTASNLTGIGILHVRAGEYDQARTRYERALAIRESIFGPTHPEVANALTNLGDVAWRTGDYARARELFERTHPLTIDAMGPEHPEVAETLNGLGLASRLAGAYAEALEYHTRSLAILERALGPEHHDLATSVGGLASVYFETGDYAAAQRLYERALAIQDRALGPEHPNLGGLLNNLANVRYELGRHEEARVAYERALAIWEKSLGPEHPAVAITLTNLANVESSLGHYPEALALHARALALTEKSVGRDHPSIARILVAMGSAYRKQRAYVEARAVLERALTLETRASGATSPELIYPLLGLAELAMKENDLPEVIEHAERAIAVGAAGDAPPERVAEARFLAAQARWSAPEGRGRDRVRALELATQARDAYRPLTAEAEELAAVEAWLAGHRLP